MERPLPQQANTFWRALTHPTRRQIIALLLERPRTTGELVDQFDVSRFAVMKHLRVLEEADLVRIRREGRRRWNVFNEAFRAAFAAAAEGAPEAATHPVERTLRLSAPAGHVYHALTAEIGAWFPRRRRPDAQIVLETRPGGLFYEGSAAAGTLLGIVTHLEPDRALQLWLPPQPADPLGGRSIELTLTPAEDGTELRVVEHPSPGHWFSLLDAQLRAYLAEATIP